MNLHERDINDHEEEGDSIAKTKSRDRDVLVEVSRHHESEESGRVGVDASADQRVIAVPHQPVMNRMVPLAPVFCQTARIPPILVETTILEPSQLRRQVRKRMEDEEEADQPEVRHRYRQIECCK